MTDLRIIDQMRWVMAETKADDVDFKMGIDGVIVVGVGWCFGSKIASFQRAYTLEAILRNGTDDFWGHFVNLAKEQRKILVNRYCLKCGEEFSEMGWCHYCDNHSTKQNKMEEGIE